VRKRLVGKRQPLRSGNSSRANTGTSVPKADTEHALGSAKAEAVRWSRLLGPTGTVAEWGERWFKDGKQRWQPTTIRSYWVVFKVHVLPRWGDVPLVEVTRADTLAWAKDLAASGLTVRTQRYVVGTLQRILRFAIEAGALHALPVDRLRLPTPKPAKVKPLTIRQIEDLAEAIESPEYASGGHGAGQPEHRQHRPDLALWVRLGAYCGLRAGEVLALRRESVDLERRVCLGSTGRSNTGSSIRL